MTIQTIEAGKPLHTLVVSHRRGATQVKELCVFQNKPVLTTDQEALIEYAASLVKKFPTATYTISRVNAVQEM